MEEGREREAAYRFQLQSREPFAFAGLYNEWESPEEGSYTITTTEPNPLAAEVHDRMPVILSAGILDTWLDPDLTNKEQLQQLLVPYWSSIQFPKQWRKVTNSQLDLIEEVSLNSK